MFLIYYNSNKRKYHTSEGIGMRKILESNETEANEKLDKNRQKNNDSNK